ncbi:cyclin-Q [Nilaparvata lugens]|uniref:cyclin-Q n=1 Tax=Nilaparvata lugens TaxID=108931 RepID=UPI000B98BA6B|nr:cyclin-Q [Nilaparvata lugens]
MKDVIDVLQLQAQKEKSKRELATNYKEVDSSFYGVQFIFECGTKLNSHPLTIATAATLFHKFFKEADKSSYDQYLIATTCLYLASKMKDEVLKVRDVMNVSHNTLSRGSAPPLDLNDEYWAMRDAIVQAELLIMRMLKFQVQTVHPHKFMLHYLKSLQGWLKPEDWKRVPLVQASYAFLQDFHYDPSIVDVKPEHIAVAAINLALQCYGVHVPHTAEEEGNVWYSVFVDDLSKDMLWDLMEKIMDVYDSEPQKH